MGWRVGGGTTGTFGCDVECFRVLDRGWTRWEVPCWGDRRIDRVLSPVVFMTVSMEDGGAVECLTMGSKYWCPHPTDNTRPILPITGPPLKSCTAWGLALSPMQ